MKRTTIDTNDELPLYQLIDRTLRTEIARGSYPIGTLLPSETELMNRFQVSRHTVRTALRGLQTSGLVKTHKGLGTKVQGPGGGQSYIHRIDRISDLFPANAETRYDPVERDHVALPAAANIFPGLGDERKWLRLTGDRRMPGSSLPLNEFEVFVAARFASVGRAIGKTSPSVYAVLESIYAETICEVEQVIGGFKADGKIGRKIGLKKGDPGIEVRRIHRLSSDNSVGIVSLNRYPIEEYTFSMLLRRVEN